jgi:hypothetical protein
LLFFTLSLCGLLAFFVTRGKQPKQASSSAPRTSGDHLKLGSKHRVLLQAAVEKHAADSHLSRLYTCYQATPSDASTRDLVDRLFLVDELMPAEVLFSKVFNPNASNQDHQDVMLSSFLLVSQGSTEVAVKLLEPPKTSTPENPSIFQRLLRFSKRSAAYKYLPFALVGPSLQDRDREHNWSLAKLAVEPTPATLMEAIRSLRKNRLPEANAVLAVLDSLPQDAEKLALRIPEVFKLEWMVRPRISRAARFPAWPPYLGSFVFTTKRMGFNTSSWRLPDPPEKVRNFLPPPPKVATPTKEPEPEPEPTASPSSWLFAVYSHLEIRIGVCLILVLYLISLLNKYNISAYSSCWAVEGNFSGQVLKRRRKRKKIPRSNIDTRGQLSS